MIVRYRGGASGCNIYLMKKTNKLDFRCYLNALGKSLDYDGENLCVSTKPLTSKEVSHYQVSGRWVKGTELYITIGRLLYPQNIFTLIIPEPNDENTQMTRRRLDADMRWQIGHIQTLHEAIPSRYRPFKLFGARKYLMSIGFKAYKNMWNRIVARQALIDHYRWRPTEP